MEKRISIILVLLICLCLPAVTFSETVVLKSGKTVEGEIIEKTDKYITIEFQGVPLTYYIDQIQNMSRDNVSSNSQPLRRQAFYEKKEPQDIFKEVSPAIVYITTTTAAGEQSLGSGYIVDSSGIIVTNFHVVHAAKEINVRLKDGKTYPVNSIVYYETNKDICILKVNAQNFPCVSLGDSSASQIGEKVYVIGNPLGLEYTFSDGMISGIRNFSGLRWLQITAPVSPGNSGGPIINTQGQVIGMVTSSQEGGQNLNFALAINEVKPFISTFPKMTVAEFAGSLNQADYYFVEGNKAILQNDGNKAISDLNKAIEINPKYADAYNSRGFVYAAQGNLTQAISDLNKAITINSNFADAYCNRGFVYTTQGNLTQAISDLNKAIEINPNFADAYKCRGVAYAFQRNLTQAIADLTKSIEINPNSYEAYNNRGTVYVSQDNYTQAISDFNKAIEINPNYADAYSNRGIFYRIQKEYDKAWIDIHRAEALGFTVNPGALEQLKKESGRDK